jgi:hypothetical protein
MNISPKKEEGSSYAYSLRVGGKLGLLQGVRTLPLLMRSVGTLPLLCLVIYVCLDS